MHTRFCSLRGGNSDCFSQNLNSRKSQIKPLITPSGPTWISSVAACPESDPSSYLRPGGQAVSQDPADVSDLPL